MKVHYYPLHAHPYIFCALFPKSESFTSALTGNITDHIQVQSKKYFSKETTANLQHLKESLERSIPLGKYKKRTVTSSYHTYDDYTKMLIESILNALGWRCKRRNGSLIVFPYQSAGNSLRKAKRLQMYDAAKAICIEYYQLDAVVQ